MKHDTPPDYDPLDIDLKHLQVRSLKPSERQRFNTALEQHHYLGDSHRVGEGLEQVVTYKGRWVALFLWGPCAKHIKCRDEFIGWDAYCAKERRKLIAQNRRFLVLGQARKPNLASKALSMAIKHLPAAWEEKYGYRPVVAETFTDPEQFHGTCYKASGWTPLGFSKGFKRHTTEYYLDEKHPKKFWIKALHPQGFYWLTCPEEHLPKSSRKGLTKESPDRSLPLKAGQIRSLVQHLQSTPDPRAKNSQFRISSLLTIVAMGLICGYNEITQIQRLGTMLTQQQRSWLTLPLKKGSKTLRRAPGYNAFYNLLKKMDLVAFAAHLNLWMQAKSGSLPKSLAVDGKSLHDRIFTINLVDHETGTPVAASAYEGKGKELPETQKLLETFEDLASTIVTADALHCEKKRSAC